MKSKNEMVREFDDIIFENRNKQYGAYNLRKKYNSAASFSILGGVIICVTLIITLSLSTERGTASPAAPDITVFKLSSPVTEKVAPPVAKAPAAVTNAFKNLKPEVTEDTSALITDIPITDVIVATGQNGNVNDTTPLIYTEQPEEIPVEKKIWINVEEMPEFPGGESALFRFISDNIKYPIEAQNNNIQGKVLLKFVITPDGSVDGIEILRSVDQALDNEAIRVVSSLPKFKPGKQNGVPVNVVYSLPVIFRIENN